MYLLRRPLLIPLVLSAFALLLITPRAEAAWGDLDPTFAAPVGYTQFLQAGNNYGTVGSVLLQSDGKILLAGTAGNIPGVIGPTVQRSLPDGSPDTSYGSGGALILHAPATFTDKRINSAALQPDGKLVAVASDALSGVLFRITTGGALDTTFAPPNGYVTLADDIPQSVVVHSSGDIFTGSNSDLNGLPVLRRFTSVGAEIGTFRTTSASNLAGVVFNDYQPLIIRQLGTGIVLVAPITDEGDPDVLAAKLDTTGSLDGSWGTGGKTTITIPDGANPEDALVQSSGALVIGGATEHMGDNAWVLARLTPGGVLDTTFVGGGKQVIDFTTGGEGINALAATPSGGFVAAGFVDNLTTDKYIGAVRMMNADGFPEAGFGPDGMRFVGFADRGTSWQGAAVQADGKVIATGSTNASPGPTAPLTARFQDSYVPPVTAPGSKVSTPSKSKISARKLTKFTGSATTNNGKVSKVEIALQRVDTKLLKKSKRCLWLSSNKAKFKKVKALMKKCSTAKWLKATGSSKWSYKLKKRLPKGKYRLSVRATATDGTVQATPTVKKFSVT